MRYEDIASHPDFRHLSAIRGIAVLALETGELTAAQVRHRALPRRVLLDSGFQGINNEWWHFDMLDRQHVRQHFTRVE